MDLISGHSKLWRELLGSFQSPSELKKEEWKNQGEEFQTRGLLFKSQLGYNEGFRKDRTLTDVLNMTSSATLHKVSHEMEKTNDQTHMRALGGRWNSSWIKDFPPEGKDQKWGLWWEARILVSSLSWRGTHEVQSVENTGTHSNSKPEGNHMNGKRKKWWRNFQLEIRTHHRETQISRYRTIFIQTVAHWVQKRSVTWARLSQEDAFHRDKALSRGHISHSRDSNRTEALVEASERLQQEMQYHTLNCGKTGNTWGKEGESYTTEIF